MPFEPETRELMKLAGCLVAILVVGIALGALAMWGWFWRELIDWGP